jgi:hypothetical protein
VDAGALCLSALQAEPFASPEPDASWDEADKHKAPTHPLIHPLSLLHEGQIPDPGC